MTSIYDQDPDPEPHGSVLVCVSESGSGYALRQNAGSGSALKTNAGINNTVIKAQKGLKSLAAVLKCVLKVKICQLFTWPLDRHQNRKSNPDPDRNQNEPDSQHSYTGKEKSQRLDPVYKKRTDLENIERKNAPQHLRARSRCRLC